MNAVASQWFKNERSKNKYQQAKGFVSAVGATVKVSADGSPARMYCFEVYESDDSCVWRRTYTS
eukprot:SAG11_NODE_4568_length_1848_cov_1.494568_2_plen_64_part_00